MKKVKKFFKNVVDELRKVKWPSKKDMVKYTIATVTFVLILSGFFYAVTVFMAFIKTLV